MKRNMNNPAYFVGKRIDCAKWTLPAGYTTCPHTGKLEAAALDIDTEIAHLVACIRRYNAVADHAEQQKAALKSHLATLIQQRGGNWCDDNGYARLSSGGTRISYDTDGLDALIIDDPVHNAWLKDYRKESPVRPSLMVK